MSDAAERGRRYLATWPEGRSTLLVMGILFSCAASGGALSALGGEGSAAVRAGSLLAAGVFAGMAVRAFWGVGRR